MSKTEYAYTTGEVGTAIATYNYTYGNAWKDQLTSYGGSAITYDTAGNPTSYLGKTLTWSRGRLLTKYVSGSKTVDMSYDANGLRISKSRKISSNTLNSTYIYDSQGKLRTEIAGNTTRTYIYGQDGIVGYEESGVHFIYRKNFFGDIVAIYQGTTKIAEYSYDAWGNCTVVSDYNGYGARNPFRYRGYYFDSDLNMYYLTTRYYDPNTGRFINADAIEYLRPAAINGLNLYAYCHDNPVMYIDPMGTDISYDCDLEEGYDPEDDLFNNAGGGGGSSTSNTTAGSYGNYGGSTYGSSGYGNSGYGNYVASNYGSYTNRSSTYGNSGFNPNQQAVISLAKEYKGGISYSNAQTLVGWATEYGISNHAPTIHHGKSGIWGSTEHIKIKNIHIPIEYD